MGYCQIVWVSSVFMRVDLIINNLSYFCKNISAQVYLPHPMSSTPREIGTLIVVILRAVSPGCGSIERSIYSIIESPPKQKEYRKARSLLFSYC